MGDEAKSSFNKSAVEALTVGVIERTNDAAVTPQAFMSSMNKVLTLMDMGTSSKTELMRVLQNPKSPAQPSLADTYLAGLISSLPGDRLDKTKLLTQLANQGNSRYQNMIDATSRPGARLTRELEVAEKSALSLLTHDTTRATNMLALHDIHDANLSLALTRLAVDMQILSLPQKPSPAAFK